MKSETATGIGRLAVAGLMAAAAALMAPQPAAAASHTTAGVRSPVPTGSVKLAGPKRLRNMNSQLCMAARAGSGERPVIQTTCDFTQGQSWPDQHWTLNEETLVTSVHNVALNLCVVARGFTERAAVATNCRALPDQEWRPVYDPGISRHFVLQNVNSGLCLAARGTTESRAVATTCDFTAGADWLDQHWEVVQ